MSGNLKTSGRALAGAYRSGIGEQAARRVPDFDGNGRDGAVWTGLVGAIDHDAVSGLHARRLTTDALMALVQVPLLEMCWRSGTCPVHRREALREVAGTLGLQPGDIGSELLLHAVEIANADEIMARWTQLIHVLVATLDPDVLRALQWEVTNRAWLMATALHGPDASRWPKPAFAALRDLECAFYETATQS